MRPTPGEAAGACGARTSTCLDEATGGSTVFGEIHARCSHSAFSLQDVVVETLGEKGELILSKHGVCAGRFEKLFGEPI